MDILFKNISLLVTASAIREPLRGADLSTLLSLRDAWLLVEDGIIADYGLMSELELKLPQLPREIVDATGKIVLPAWCDSHTHLVFAGSREHEFVDKIRGLSYAEIAAKGGGILHSARKLADTPEEVLFSQAWERLQAVAKLGTGSIEIKSGYGLSVEAELKMLRVIKKLKERSSLQIKATFLGAHAFPLAYKEDHAAYIRSLTDEMLPVIAADGLADYIDVFCEQGFFSPGEMETVCRAGQQYGLPAKLHIHQLSSNGGLQKAIELGALSVDHLETMTEQDIRDLAGASTIGTLLPTAAFFLRMPYQPARALIDSGCAIALASDYNPGSSPSGNMNFVVALSCIQMKMLPAEAIQAATINGAFAMGVEKTSGSIAVGKRADLILTTPVPSLEYLPYAFGTNCIERVMIRGEWV